MNGLLRGLHDAGLIQFGAFIDNGETVPFRASLDMLASYPVLLRDVAGAAAALVPSVDHLLCPVHAVPLGTALSLHVGVPLVYSRGSKDDAVHDLVGAYDIGHPTVLVLNVLDNAAQVEPLITNARRVGLVVESVIAVIDTGAGDVQGLPVQSVFQLANVVSDLVESGAVPAGQGRAVRTWIEGRRRG